MKRDYLLFPQYEVRCAVSLDAGMIILQRQLSKKMRQRLKPYPRNLAMAVQKKYINIFL